MTLIVNKTRGCLSINITRFQNIVPKKIGKMSTVKSWFTKEEVLKDLAKVSGHRVTRVGRLENDFMVRGDAPPPVMVEAEDEEMLEQFGNGIRERCTSTQADIVAPDLHGITSMLRMVQGSEDEGDVEDSMNTGDGKECVITIRKPTYLNPNVKPFVPKVADSSPNLSEVQEEKVKTEPINVKVEANKDVNNVPVENTDQNNDQELLVAKLKNTISDASKSSSFELKKQKNLAIASLLRLYAKPPEKEKTEAVKLITPDFFQNCVTSSELKVESPEKVSPSVSKSEISSSPSNNGVQSESSTDTTNTSTSSSKPRLDPAIKTSIDKVNQWMGIKEEKKTPSVFLGAISFKRKEPKTSSISDTESITKNIAKPNHSKQYKPSGYAADLGRKYMEENEAREKKELNKWDNIDLLLKQRDEQILQKRREGQSSSSSNN